MVSIDAGRPDDYVLYLTAFRDLDYCFVRDAVATAAAAGVRVVGMVTEKAPPSASRPR